MGLGPIELVFVRFPGSDFNGGILPALEDVVNRGIITIIDCLLVTRTAEDEIELIEIEDVSDNAEVEALQELISEANGLISDEDIDEFAWSLDVGDSAAALVFEHTWVKPFRDAVVGSGGELVANLRIPGVIADEVLAAISEEA
jgi:Family of unknown function (DUF6325)